MTYRPRPIRPTYASDSTWRRWLVDDQRFAADRTDVLTYQTIRDAVIGPAIVVSRSSSSVCVYR